MHLTSGELSIVAPIATLAGVMITGLIALAIQRANRRTSSEQWTRDKRLDLYLDVMAWSTDVSRSSRMDLDQEFDEENEPERWLDLYRRMTLIGSTVATDLMRQVADADSAMWNAKAEERRFIGTAHQELLHTQVVQQFMAAARANGKLQERLRAEIQGVSSGLAELSSSHGPRLVARVRGLLSARSKGISGGIEEKR